MPGAKAPAAAGQQQAQAAAGQKAEVKVVATDLNDPAKVREVTRGAKVVYQSAQPHYHEWPEKFPPLQKAIIDGLSGNGTKLVIVENVYMYGEMNGRALSEDLPYRAHTRKGKVRGKMSMLSSNPISRGVCESRQGAEATSSAPGDSIPRWANVPFFPY